MDFEEQKVPDSILDKYTKVCTCRSISRKTIKEAINDGCDTIPKIRERTGAVPVPAVAKLWCPHR